MVQVVPSCGEESENQTTDSSQALTKMNLGSTNPVPISTDWPRGKALLGMTEALPFNRS